MLGTAANVCSRSVGLPAILASELQAVRWVLYLKMTAGLFSQLYAHTPAHTCPHTFSRTSHAVMEALTCGTRSHCLLVTVGVNESRIED